MALALVAGVAAVDRWTGAFGAAARWRWVAVAAARALTSCLAACVAVAEADALVFAARWFRGVATGATAAVW